MWRSIRAGEGYRLVLFLLCLAPALWLGWGLAFDALGAEPVKAVEHASGEWALRLLLLTLAMTPLRRFFGWGWPLRVRRMVGLFAFFYALLHLAGYVWLDKWFLWEEIGEDLLKRPYITLGMVAFVILLLLAVTSTRGAQRRLGRGWKRLHRLVYAAAVLGVVHFLLLVKADLREPLLYAAVLALLLAARLPPLSAAPPSPRGGSRAAPPRSEAAPSP